VRSGRERPLTGYARVSTNRCPMNDELQEPLILRLCREQESRPRSMGERPTWGSSVAETVYGVWYRSEDRWWQRVVFRLLGDSPRLLSPFWGWRRHGS